MRWRLVCRKFGGRVFRNIYDGIGKAGLGRRAGQNLSCDAVAKEDLAGSIETGGKESLQSYPKLR